ncbi:MAG: GtrA family protein [Deltaproteobacteria bacterium]|nr:GtrA family protein [Deltaproteobacteria bacterium]
MSPDSPVTRRDPLRVVRAFLAGAAATLADLAVLTLLVSAFGVAPRIANVPALLAGGIVNFLGNRHFAFKAAQGSLAKQATLYTLVELVALALNGVLFDLAMRLPFVAPHAAAWVVPVRLVTSHLVFLAWSYPLWRLVFKVPRAAQAV